MGGHGITRDQPRTVHTLSRVSAGCRVNVGNVDFDRGREGPLLGLDRIDHAPPSEIQWEQCVILGGDAHGRAPVAFPRLTISSRLPKYPQTTDTLDSVVRRAAVRETQLAHAVVSDIGIPFSRREQHGIYSFSNLFYLNGACE